MTSSIASKAPKPLTITEAFATGDINEIAAIYYGVLDRIIDHQHASADIVVAPAKEDGQPDWDQASPLNLEKPSSDSGPADMAEARRWAILIDDIDACDGGTSLLLNIDPASGEPIIEQIAGPNTDRDIAIRVLCRDIAAKPTRKPFELGKLAQGILDAWEASKAPPPAANDNEPAIDPRLIAFGDAYGGEIRGTTLFGATVDGKRGQISFSAAGQAWLYTINGASRISLPKKTPGAISATSWKLLDPKSIPPREWLYGHHYIRKFVSVTVSPGGVGKTSLGMGEALSMATGRELFGAKVHQRSRVWIWNGEDPQEELDRRLTAACLHYGIAAHEIDGMLFVDSGRNMPLITARQTKDGAQIAMPVVDRLCEEIASKGIDVMIVDPFVSSHAITENDNMAMDAVVKQAWATIADRTNCSIDLVHHAKKMGGQEVTAESARGGVALIGAARAARVLNPMTADEAKSVNVENRRLHFRETDAKSNLAPPSEKSIWYKMQGHDLGNATNERPADNVGVATVWLWPSATEGLKVSDLLAVQKIINAGSYKDSVQAANWAGHAVAEALGLDAETNKGRIKALLKVWKASGALVVEQKEDSNRKLTPHIVVGEWAYDT
ncbi:AAA family ATPase [Rhizobium leucaenae]|uniref:Uncharacterized protein n=1 Tax=Rhizobium leucaenae TaxID=29450 RepID=A0A7W6ZZS4_9HYPH|nr:AAA family ATPase [Rhizobium leucaenae]MBB4571734.1 hypothetical protein [Rhizobium leucaenae]